MSKKSTTKFKVHSEQSLPQGDTDWARVDALDDAQAEQAALSDPDAQPTSPEMLARFQRVVDVKTVRETLALSQEEFADTFHLSLATIQAWEQQKQQPDPVARVLLQVIARQPDAVKKALAQTPV